MRWHMKLLAVVVVVCAPENVGWGQTPLPQLNKKKSVSTGVSCVEPEWFERGQFEDESGIPLAKFGEKIAIDQRNAIVLAQIYRPDSESREAGFAFIYKRLSESWELVQTIVAPPNTFFSSIALRDGLLVLGVPWNGGVGEEAYGAVYLYRADADRSNWTFEGKLLAPVHPDIRGFGASIDLSETRMVVGTNISGNALVIYKRQSDVWEVEAILSVPRSELEGLQSFGDQVAIEGDVLVTGTPYPIGVTGLETRPSETFVYRLVGGAWTLETRIEFEILLDFHFHLQENLLVIKPGYSYLQEYEYTENEWSLKQAIVPPGDFTINSFAGSDLQDDRLVFGGLNTGGDKVILLYERNAIDGAWSHRETIEADVNESSERFGRSMALADNALAVGSPGLVPQVAWGGRAFIFDRLPPLDCDANGFADHCEIDQDWMKDLNFNRILDDCDTPGDVDGNGIVDVNDLLDLLAQWGACSACFADADRDGVVAIDDLLTLLQNWD
ncbi:MAG: hypothetical protein O7G85_14820 [Planctomycetota bacterium]|nr:hypothetical protein [Planctomycetota bacterium]